MYPDNFNGMTRPTLLHMTRHGTHFAISAGLVMLLALPARAQNVGINANGAAPNPTALLDIDASALPSSAAPATPVATTGQDGVQNDVQNGDRH